MNRIRNFFEQFIKLHDSEWEDFAGRLLKEEVKKKAKIISEGQHCDFIAFIAEGSFRFYYNKDGFEQVTAFFFADEFITNYRSFLTNKPSTHSIQALSDSVIFKISKTDLYELYDKYRNFERIGRYITENIYLSIANRLDIFLNETPEERYIQILNRNPRYLKEIPQYMIASYLGIKPETLSRIRSRI